MSNAANAEGSMDGVQNPPPDSQDVSGPILSEVQEAPPDCQDVSGPILSEVVEAPLAEDIVIEVDILPFMVDDIEEAPTPEEQYRIPLRSIHYQKNENILPFFYEGVVGMVCPPTEEGPPPVVGQFHGQLKAPRMQAPWSHEAKNIRMNRPQPSKSERKDERKYPSRGNRSRSRPY